MPVHISCHRRSVPSRTKMLGSGSAQRFRKLDYRKGSYLEKFMDTHQSTRANQLGTTIMKPINQTQPKNVTTREVVATVHRTTAKTNGGAPAPWTERLQSVADKRVQKDCAPAPTASPLVDRREIQLNRNNDAFWQSRGFPERPADWQTRDTRPAVPPPEKRIRP